MPSHMHTFLLFIAIKMLDCAISNSDFFSRFTCTLPFLCHRMCRWLARTIAGLAPCPLLLNSSLHSILLRIHAHRSLPIPSSIRGTHQRALVKQPKARSQHEGAGAAAAAATGAGDGTADKDDADDGRAGLAGGDAVADAAAFEASISVSGTSFKSAASASRPALAGAMRRTSSSTTIS